MRPIHIVTDSTCDIPAEILRQYNITVVSLYVTLDGEALSDDQITPQEIFAHTERTGKLPQTTAIAPQDMMDEAQRWIDDGYDVLYIGLSSGVSACHSIGLMLEKEFEPGRFTAFDTKRLSSAVGLMAIRAARMVQQGMDVPTMLPLLTDMTNRMHTSFFLDQVQYLHYGGRCSTVQLLGANLLKLRPMILMPDGKLVAGDKLRGSVERCVELYLQKILPDWQVIQGPEVALCWSGGCEQAFELIEKAVRENRPDLEILKSTACNVISCHCGPGTIGLLFETKPKG